MNEVLICQIVLLLILSLVTVVVFLHRASKRSLGKQAGQYCDALFIWFPDENKRRIFCQACQKDKSLSLRPSLKSSGWSGLVPSEVFYTNDEVFFASRHRQGCGGTLKICGVPQIPLCLSLCFIIKAEFSMQHEKHIEKFCTAAPAGDRWRGREMDVEEGGLTYQSSRQYFNKQNARDAFRARKKWQRDIKSHF